MTANDWHNLYRMQNGNHIRFVNEKEIDRKFSDSHWICHSSENTHTFKRRSWKKGNVFLQHVRFGSDFLFDKRQNRNRQSNRMLSFDVGDIITVMNEFLSTCPWKLCLLVDFGSDTRVENWRMGLYSMYRLMIVRFWL